MVTVNSISATPRASMGRGLSSLEPGERRAQRSASTLSPDYLALHRSRFVSLFLSALLFSSFLYLFIHSILLFPSFSLQPPLFPRETPSLVLRTVFFLLLYLLYFSFLPLPLLFYNPFIIFFFFFPFYRKLYFFYPLYIHNKHLFSPSRSCVFSLPLFFTLYSPRVS